MNKLTNKLLNILLILFLTTNTFNVNASEISSDKYNEDEYIYNDHLYNEYNNGEYLEDYTSDDYSLKHHYDYYIKNMDVKVEINDKREYVVTETIDTHFNMYKHGIIRHIPRISSVENVRIEDIKVSGDKCSVIKEGASIVLRIGDENKTIIGDKQYIIQYTLKHYTDNVKDADYAYMNILGDQWDVPIKNFNATVSFPNNFTVNDFTITSGSYGSTSNDYALFDAFDNHIEVKSNDIIPPETGITINIKFEEGAFSNVPTNYLKYFYVLFLISNFGLLLLTIFYVVKAKRRDDGIIKPVEFYPPEDLNPLEVGYLYNGRIENDMITSLIYKWASDGFIKIEVSNDKIYLLKLRELSTHYYQEKVLFNKIFSCGKSNSQRVCETDLEYELGNYYNSVRNDVIGRYKGDSDYNKKSSSIYHKISGIFFVLFVLSVTYLHLSGRYGTYAWINAAVVSVFIGVWAIFVRASMGYNFNETFKHNTSELGYSPVTMLLVMIIFYILSLLFDVKIDFIKSIVLLTPLMISLLLTPMIQFNKSNKEEELYGRICGFKDFIEKAEKDRLEILLAEDDNYFYNILPYAQVLGLTKLWNDKFENIDIKPSENYNFGYYNSFTLSNSLNSTMKSAYAPRPSDSSSGGGYSGGGSCGGGSGGGGGSSW